MIRQTILVILCSFVFLSALLCPAGPASASCDATGNHLRWLDGVGTSGDVSAAARVGDTVISVTQGSSVSSFVVDPDGTLEDADALGLPAIRAIAVGDMAYVSTSDKIQLISFDGQSMMSFAGNLPLTNALLTLSGDYVYASNATGFHVIDVSDPALPSIVGQTTGAVGYVTAAGDRAYISASSGVWSVDVSDPTNPLFVGNVIPTGTIEQIVADGTQLYVANLTVGLEVYDLTLPDAPALVGAAPIFGPRSVILGEDRVLVGASSADNYIVDVSNPAAPQVTGVYNGVTSDGGVIEEGRAYMACGGLGLQVLELNDGTSPDPVASFSQWPDGEDLVVFGDHLVYRLRDSLEVLDVSDPTAPEFVTSLPYGFTNALVAAGAYAYLAHEDWFRVLDFSNPASPQEVGSLADMELNLLTVSGDRVYGAIFGQTVTLDVSDPTQPTAIGFDTSLFPDALAANGTELYVAVNFEGNGTLYRMDFTDPNAPTILQTRGTTVVQHILTDGDALYVSSRGGFTVHDGITLDPEAIIGSAWFAGQAMIPGFDSSVLCLGGTGQLHSFGLLPELEYQFTAPSPAGNADGIADIGSHLIVTDSDGLHLFERPCVPAGFDPKDIVQDASQLRAFPNPSEGPIRFEWSAETSPHSPARLDLFSVSGRLLRSIEVAAGRTTVDWDGRNDAGDKVPNGLVLARWKTDSGTASRTVWVLR